MRITARCAAILAVVSMSADPALSLTKAELDQALKKENVHSWQTVKIERLKKHHVLGMNRSRRLSLPDPDAEARPAAWQGLPSKFDWRQAYGHDWTTPVSDQAQCGSCVAFATVGAMEIQTKINSNAPGDTPRFSQQDLFSRIGTCNSGADIGDAMDTAESAGVPDLACYPYKSGKSGQDFPASGACKDRQGRAVKATRWAMVATADLKAALQNGPVVTAMEVFEDFDYYDGGVYRHVSGKDEGGHAVTIVGYDDEEKAWIVRNSWGPSFGEGGYFRIAYGDPSGVAVENWQLDVPAEKSH